MKTSTIATLVHTFLHFRKQIIQQSRRSLREAPDIHARLMSVYSQGNITIFMRFGVIVVLTHAFSSVPDWWYLVLFLVMFALGVISIELWHTQLPVWAFVIALLIGRSTFSVIIDAARR